MTSRRGLGPRAGHVVLANGVEFQIGKVLFFSSFFHVIIIPSLKLYFSFSLALSGDGKRKNLYV